MHARRRTDRVWTASDRAYLLLSGLLILTAASAIGSLAAAEVKEDRLSYTYVDGSYVSTDIDKPLNVDGDGARVEGSLAITDRLFLLGDYTSQDLDFGLDLDQIGLGIGGRIPLSTGLDLVGSAAYLHSAWDAGPVDSEDDALRLGLGLRGLLTERLEFEGGVRYADLDVLDDLMVSLNGRYYVTSRLALGAGLDAGDDMSIWNLGVRYDFD